MPKRPWYYEQASFYDKLTEEQRESIVRMAVRKRFHKGEIICHLDDPCEYIYILLKGTAKVYLLTIDGREQILAIRQPGNIIGLTAIFGWKKRLSYVAALDDVEILSVRSEDLRQFIMSEMHTAVLIINILVARLHHSRMIIEDLSTKNVRKRLINFFLNLANDIGVETSEGIIINLPLTHEQISQIVASSRQTVTLMINDLAKSKLLTKRRNKIIILDIKGLQNLIK